MAASPGAVRRGHMAKLGCSSKYWQDPEPDDAMLQTSVFPPTTRGQTA
jgi:hypothetical protein